MKLRLENHRAGGSDGAVWAAMTSSTCGRLQGPRHQQTIGVLSGTYFHRDAGELLSFRDNGVKIASVLMTEAERRFFCLGDFFLAEAHTILRMVGTWRGHGYRTTAAASREFLYKRSEGAKCVTSASL